MKNLIVLSGNVGSGLTTYGKILSDKLRYDWLPEDPFISTYEKINKSTERDYCLLSLIENAINKTIFVNEQFLKGKETIIIERFILDELVRFRDLMDLYTFDKHINIYGKLISLLDSICCDIRIEHLLIKTNIETLKKRNENRQDRFKYTVHEGIIKNIDDLYEDKSLYRSSVIHRIVSDGKSNEEILLELLEYIENIVVPLHYNSKRLHN